MPHSKARLAGLFYLLCIVTALFAVIIRWRIVVAGDGAATASNMLANEALFDLAFVNDILATVFYLAVTALFYELFKPVNRSVSLLAALCSLTGCVIGGVACVFHIAPLMILKSTSHVFNADQMRELALMIFRLRAQAGNTGIIFFGFYCVLIGWLVYRSTFLPRAIGVLTMIAGIGWLTSLMPPLASAVAPWNMLAGVVGEASLTFWLLFAGVNEERRREPLPA